MKPEQSVYNKLHKFSAKEEPMKVEFRDVKELKSVNSDAKQLLAKIDKVSGQFDSKVKAYQNAWAGITDVNVMANELYDNMSTFLKRANSERTAFEKNAKQLGVSPSDISEYDVLLKSIANAESSRDQLAKMVGVLKNLG
jgi:leucyl-tRNA synthetase